MREAPMQAPAREAQPQGGLLGIDREEMEDAEADPGFISARDWIVDKLFGSGDADRTIAEAIRNSEGDGQVMSTIAEIAYTAIDEADAQAQPPMKEENLIPLAFFVLEQFWDVAAAAQQKAAKDIDPAAIASSFKVILIRFLDEAGVDTSELSQAMNQVSPDQFRGLVSEVAGAVDGEQEAMR